MRPKYLFDTTTSAHKFNVDCPSVPFHGVLQDFAAWLKTLTSIDINVSLGKGSTCNFAFVTCGDWVCKSQIPNQCKKHSVPCPPGFRRFTDLKKIFGTFVGKDALKGGMKGVLAHFGWLTPNGDPFWGFRHSGMHDVENIAMCVIAFLAEPKFNGSLPITSAWQRNKAF